MTNSIFQAIAEARKLALKADAPLEVYARCVEVTADRQAELDASNRSTDEEKATLRAYMEGLNGNVSPELAASDICVNAGVRINRGTSQFAAREKKRLLLAYHK